jgi:beta-N-acetylhexosaminidase
MLFALLAFPAGTQARQEQPPGDWTDEAAALFQTLSPEERVGQLFLVTFRGDRAPNESDIADLIRNYHIGGVALSGANGNFTGYGDPALTPTQTRELANNLQRLALGGNSLEPPADTANGDAVPPSPEPRPTGVPIPLLVASGHEDDALPLDDVKDGFSGVPNNMAIGATWQPAFARRVGDLAGYELATSGLNLLLGPSLDVLEKPSPLNDGDLGTHSFGGDPYWVGLLGRSYIEGLHAGSNGRLAVAAKRFPGQGSSDRSIDEEVPTVRKSLEQLKQIELAPFFAVTRDSLGAGATADALLASHIRYQGFQGNIRATTAPVSLDPQALNALLTLPELAPWRASGGIVVSDALGVRSIERFYDDTEQEFPHRQVAKDALLAGNDLLYTADFALGQSDQAAELSNIRDTITWFREKYETDPAFQQRVDDAVLRILELKLRLYGGSFAPENVIVEPGVQVPIPAAAGDDLFDIAQSAVTLLSPSEEELNGRPISPPGINDRIVIFTDVRDYQPCDDCPIISQLPTEAFQERMLALYGPTGSNQVQPDSVSSFSFADLDEFLAAGPGPIPLPTPIPAPTEDVAALATQVASGTLQPLLPTFTPTPEASPTPPAGYRVQEALAEADWIIVAGLNGGAAADHPNAQALSRFLAQRPDIVGRAQVVAFAFDAPYFLDSTEISKLTAYYGIYSKTPAFVDAAVRALFQDSPLTGASPVSVEGVRYDLFSQTQPDPAQIIELFFVVSGQTQSPSQEEPQAAAIGDTLQLRTGIIRDRNNHQVPDGTLVRFVLRDRVQGTVTIIGDRPTSDGVAQLDYVLDARMGPGQFRITAESGEATVSQEVDIVIEDEAQLAIIVPTPLPTETPEPTPSPTFTPAPTERPTPLPPTATPATPPIDPNATLLEQLARVRAAAAMIGGLLATGVFGIVLNRSQHASASSGVGRILWGLVGALLVYNYFALGLPGADILGRYGAMAALAVTLIGGLAGLLLYRPQARR